MTPRRDDDALSWEGDDDPTLDIGSKAQPEPEPEPEATNVLPEGFTAVGPGSEAYAADAETARLGDQEHPAAASAQIGNATLIGLGVLGGVYLLYAVGWIVGGLRLRGTAQFLVSPVTFDVSTWLAAATPVIWFATVYLLTRSSKAWVRIVWLVAGALLLIPWPFIMVGVIGR